MPQLKYITIYNNQISEIPVNTFVECEFLQSLSLHINMIRSIEINTFINMTNLYTLYLHNNKIRSLKSYTFINMTNLQNLQLQNNEISIIESFTFMNLPSLQYLYLFNNEISVIEPFTFVNLPSLQYLYLRNNKIRLLESYTFINTTNVYYINLSENNISHIEEHAFGNFTLLSDLILTSNPLNCDCSIYPFWSWLSERACKVTSAKCSNGTSVTSLQVAALDKCNPNNCQCFNGGTCVMTDIGRMCDCIGHWTGKFCQESQCNSYNCGFGDCYIEPMNGTAQCFCGDRYSNYCPGKLCYVYLLHWLQ
ncbi:uncharacterized protein LOC143052881 isoform X1 [Mytilus galloprovincialis]|uniref:uncharacterized protein LOC143052881 isoform X1 n=1 Tax=Mytilus galloprovincialis TaxID=29158 RepID=UPI003F7C1644